MKPIRLILADDQQLFIDGLSALLAYEKEIEIVGKAGNGMEVLDLLGKKLPDVVVTDIQMPELNGIELTRELRYAYPELPVIGLTMFGEDHLIVDMLEAGARGY